ncbi:TetR/AcrR family transcriptional regulator C-terminal domain-containing protein [Streptomyces sp. NPDC007971]|uniref:TetR/AcrR family transcriptional regulator C-terminal domain-containing protein n=1 Tax=Streptomyces sp. NPDC007971 TaxID=3364799 RepID=UPI0036E688AE
MSVIEDQTALTGPADTWQERLPEIARGLRTAPLGYRDGAKVCNRERARRPAGQPLAAKAGRVLCDGYDEQFEEGLALVIAGIEARRTG